MENIKKNSSKNSNENHHSNDDDIFEDDDDSNQSKNEIIEMSTISSDDGGTSTEFFDLPLPPLPSTSYLSLSEKFLNKQNYGFHHSIASFMLYRNYDEKQYLASEEADEENYENNASSSPSSSSPSISGNSTSLISTEDDGTSTIQNESKWCTSDEESSFYKDQTPTCKYDSTCCDEDFTWVCSETSTGQRKPSTTQLLTANNNNNNNNSNSNNNATGKPPPPSRSSSSLERRRHYNQNSNNSSNRRDRDQKTRSTHSLKEKYLTNESKNSQQRHISKGQRKELLLDNYCNEPSPSYSSMRCRRGSPAAYWEPPPPPPSTLPFPNSDNMHMCWGYQSSREDLRMHDYYRKHDYYRYGSTSTLPLSSSQEFFHNNNGGLCCSRYQQPPPFHCSCNHKMSSSSWNLSQKPDIDERLRRLQNEKDTLSVQVQILTDQISAQNNKILELEKCLTEKTQLLNSTEDMLQREMLSRSSLETQKLELMSAISELKLQQAALERDNFELRATHTNNNNSLSRRPPLTGSTRFSVSTSQQQQQQQQMQSSTNSTLNNATFHGSIGSLQQSVNLTTSPIAPKTPPASFRHQVNPHFNSLPRTSFSSSFSTSTPQQQQNSQQQQEQPPQNNIIAQNINMTNSTDNNANPKLRNVAFAETEKVIEDALDMQRSFTPQPGTSPSLGQKTKGLRSIFGKMKRSNSGNLEDLPGEGEFKRGGIRATAGARLGWSEANKPNKPFKEWDVNEICSWFDEMGLGCHEEDLKKWLVNGGSDLIEASPVDIEKELSLKSPLHRKKIVLAIAELSGKEKDEMMLNAGKLDITWVMRWLDDIGLPQHKDAFSIARLDGRMLHKLTMDDLASLHITSSLHVVSLRRGIQVMRENNWNPDCLIRRSNSENIENEQVALWTAHRVMEWLRVVDLAEYAPNLRGAGVHGALMIYEPRFTAELLADLLSIPPSKTLLRRHLATHFKELLGRDVIQGKRDAENTLGYQPLTITSKIKTPKKSQFSLKRRKSTKGGDEWTDLVCPMGASGDNVTSSSTTTTTTNAIITTTTTTTTTTTISSSNQNATNATDTSMMKHLNQDNIIGSEPVSLQTSAGSPTSTRSSNSSS